jgi:hypothetical protein
MGIEPINRPSEVSCPDDPRPRSPFNGAA